MERQNGLDTTPNAVSFTGEGTASVVRREQDHPKSNQAVDDKSREEQLRNKTMLLNTRLEMIRFNMNSIQSLNEKILAHIHRADTYGALRFPETAPPVALQMGSMVETLLQHKEWFEKQNEKLWRGAQQDWLYLSSLQEGRAENIASGGSNTAQVAELVWEPPSTTARRRPIDP